MRIGGFRHFLLGLLATATAAGALAQDGVFNLRVDVQSVSLDVTVRNAAGEPMLSLLERDFSIFEDGVEQEIKSFSALDTPYNILLLFDRSGSTEDQWRTMQRAASTFARNMRKQDRVALASFEDGLTMLSSWKDMPAQIDRALGELLKRGPGGGSNLYWSLERATRREFRGIEGRRAVVVLTDGRDSSLGKQTSTTGSPPSAATDPAFKNTLAVVREARIPLYFVALNTDRNPGGSLGEDYYSLENRYFTGRSGMAFLAEVRHRMELLADASGGRVFFPKNLRDVIVIYDDISLDMSTAYSLSYISSQGGAESGQVRKIEVRVRRRDSTVHQSRDSYLTP
jgi:Ca-activated chloride channel family protein